MSSLRRWLSPLVLLAFLHGPARARAGEIPAAPALPVPGGNHVIGTLLVDWTDTEREETWTEDPDDRRRVVVQFWYPAEAQPLRVPAPYVLRYSQLRESLDRFWSHPFPTISTHAALEAPVLESEAPYPVVLFSHAMNSSRIFYTAFAEELASHGYVVAMIDHPYWGPAVAFENGRTVDFAKGTGALEALGPDRMDERMQEGITTMAEDQAFVARMLGSMTSDRRVSVRRLGRRLDLDRIAVMGHGMGGMAAVRAAFSYRTFKAAVTLDGYAWSMAGISPLGSPAAPSTKPLLVLLSEGGVHGDSLTFARRHLDAFREPTVVRLSHVRPGSVSDLAFLRPGPHLSVDAAAHREICDAVRAFLDEHLKGYGYFSDVLARFDGAERLDLRTMIETASRTARRQSNPAPASR